MTELPKIAHDRLREASRDRGAPGQTHPDADLLTAFAEQTLLEAERDGVFEHLALCKDCRDVIALALPPTDNYHAAEPEAVRAAARPERSWLNFDGLKDSLKMGSPSLRWVALAAGVAVAASVLLVHPGRMNQTTSPAASPQVATTTPPASNLQMTSSMTPSPTPVPVTPSSHPSSAPAQPRQSESAMLLGRNRTEPRQAGKMPAAADNPALGGSAGREANETVTVAAAAPESSAAGTLMARNETQANAAPAIEKAKPPLQLADTETTGQQKTETAIGPRPAESEAWNVMSAARLTPAPAAAQAALQPKVAWTITAGVLQRSVDNGRSWQDAVHPDHPLLCQASLHQDVWTGGQAGTLFHSADGGVTWLRIRPSIGAQTLAAGITHIDLVSNDLVSNDLVSNDLRRNEVQAPAQVVLSTSNHEIWSSADSGKTWAKK
jgi:hypothetical protein